MHVSGLLHWKVERDNERKHTVNVGRTTGVVTREDGLELRNTVLVALLETTEESLVEVALVVRVAVSTGDNTGVDTLK